jgi:hypothetical protein
MTDSIKQLFDEIDRLHVNLAFCREAMRHADIDLSMALPLVNGDMQKSIRKTLDRIDEARERANAIAPDRP